jgi:demethylmenaquinone methyltransferase/2-methoxy-6-polyprenyl-1,4-benzoquinol methylase
MTSAPASAAENPSRKEVWRMFDRIAHRYDLLNRMLSFGRDTAWRKRLVRQLPGGEQLRVLDLATGTADVLLSLYKSGHLGPSVGMDMSEGMLEYGRRKVAERGLADQLELKHGDAMDTKEPSGHYDVVTIAFGIRNVLDFDQALRDMYRVLKPGGRLLVLEFSLPENSLIRAGYLFYFRHILPRVGGLISGDSYAYNYLNKTVETFPYGDAFMNHIQKAGFDKGDIIPLTFGVASIYQADKPSDSTKEA